jgi:CHAD domain-containing protein
VTAIAARELIHAQARKLRKRARDIGAHSGADDYHAVRIRAKRLRYTLGPFAELFGDAGRDYLRGLAKLQTVLGNHHDAQVRADRFGALAANDLPATTSFALGRLVERDAGTLAEHRAKFPKAWRRLRKRRWRALDAAMRDAAIGS